MKKAAKGQTINLEVKILYKIIEIIGISKDLDSLLNQIAHTLAVNLKGDSCFIYHADHNSHTLKLSGAWPPHPYHVGKIHLEEGEGITGWVAKHKTTVCLSKKAYKDLRFKIYQNIPEDKFEAFLSTPIILKKEVIGVINIFNKKPKAFSKNVIQLLNSIASQISGAIEKTKLVETTEKKARQLQTIAKLSSSIVSNAYLNEILQLIVTMTAQMMDSKICSLMLLDDKKQELKIAATQSLSDEYKRKPAIKSNSSVSGEALNSKKPVVVVDVTKEPKYGYPEIASKEGLKSMIAVPMLIKDKPIGVVNCYTTKEHIFSEEEINSLQTIANQSAIAIENTNLLEESKNTKEALETRKIVERAKGVLMRSRHIGEDEAFNFIQKQAMDLRRNMREISEAIILSEGINKTGPKL
ncbi:GAF domain-containing protein [Elusimicrobiota bacterium]